jgi:hypothetical protein
LHTINLRKKKKNRGQKKMKKKAAKGLIKINSYGQNNAYQQLLK